MSLDSFWNPTDGQYVNVGGAPKVELSRPLRLSDSFLDHVGKRHREDTDGDYWRARPEPEPQPRQPDKAAFLPHNEPCIECGAPVLVKMARTDPIRCRPCISKASWHRCHSPVPLAPRVCPVCGATYQPKEPNQIWCGRACKVAAITKPVVVVEADCRNCGRHFSYKRHGKEKEHYYCSIKCGKAYVARHPHPGVIDTAHPAR